MNLAELRGKYKDALTPSDEISAMKNELWEKIPNEVLDTIQECDTADDMNNDTFGCYICGSFPGKPSNIKRFCSRCGLEP